MDKKLLDNFEDARMALLLDEFAKEEGEALLAESGQLEESEAFKAECLALIDKAFAKRRRVKRFRRAVLSTARAALITFAVLGALTVGLMSVEAIRVPVLNFLIEYHEKFTSVIFTPSDQVTVPVEGMVQEGPLAGLLPDAFYIESDYSFPDGMVSVVYATEEGKFVYYSSQISDGLGVSFDTENAERYEETTLLGYRAFLVEKEGQTFILWVDEEKGFVYELSTDCMDTYDLWRLAERVAAMK